MAASWIILLCNLQNRESNFCHNLDQKIISCAKQYTKTIVRKA